MLAGLVHQADLGYLGAFNLPGGEVGVSTFEYGGTALAYNPANDSLFMVGHDWDQAIAEVTIPALGAGPLEGLPTADVIQPFSRVLDRVPNNTLQSDETVKLGGLMVYGDQLIGTAYEYYDGNGDAVDSHFTLSSQDLASASVSGLFPVGTMGGGFVGGYMAEVPAEWRDELGTSYLTGQAALSIISRTSAGPAAFGFDPAQLGSSPAPATPLLYYPLDHPLAPVETENPLFNTATEIRGIVFPEGTDSVLFIGSHGVGPWWYGESSEEGYDPYRFDKGPHAAPYVYQVWAYDVHDLVAAKNGEVQPWEVQPYDVWTFDLPYPEDSKHIGGVAYDSATGRLFVSQQYGNAAYPVVHAFQVGAPSDVQPAVSLAPTVTSLDENTAVPSDLKVADITVQGAAEGAYALALSGADQDDFVIAGTSLYLKAGTTLDYEAQPSHRVTVELSSMSPDSMPARADYTLSVTDVSDTPIAVSLTPLLTSLPENTAMSSDLKVAEIAVNGGAPETNALFLSGADQAAFVISGNSLYLKADATLDYETQTSYRVTVEARDASPESASANASYTLSVTDANDAPVLNNALNPALAPIAEDTVNPAGTLVADLLAGALTDPDVGAMGGMAVIGTGGASGAWQYSLDGGSTWQEIGGVSETSARLLAASAQTRLRFVPAANFNGQATLLYRAWDQSAGLAGQTFNLAGNYGGAAAFSAAIETAVQTVTPVNDAPVLDTGPLPSLPAINEDSKTPAGRLVKALLTGAVADPDAGALKGIAVTSLTGTASGAWQYSLDGARWTTIDAVSNASALLLSADGLTRVRFVPNRDFHGTVRIYYRAWDQTDGSTAGARVNLTGGGKAGGATAFSTAVESATLTVLPVNDAPLLSLGGNLGYKLNSAAVVVAGSAAVTDVDSANFQGGQLRVSISTGADASNRIEVGGAFTRFGNQLRLGSEVIGTLNTNGGIGTTDLLITLTAKATPDIVQQLVRSITFRTVGATSSSQRVINFLLSDGDGAASHVRSRTVNVRA